MQTQDTNAMNVLAAPKKIAGNTFWRMSQQMKQIPIFNGPLEIVPNLPDIQNNNKSGIRSGIHFNEVQETLVPLYRNYAGVEIAEIPENITRLASQVGVNNLVERCVIPPHRDTQRAFAGRNNNRFLNIKKMALLNINSKHQPTEFFNDFKRAYDGQLKYNSKLPPLELPSPQKITPKASVKGERVVEEFPVSRWVSMDMLPPETELDCGWVVKLIDGEVDTSMASYKLFYQRLKENGIEDIVLWILDSIGHIMKRFSVPIAVVKCKETICFAKCMPEYPISIEKIKHLLFNVREVENLIKEPGRVFQGKDGKQVASYVISKAYQNYRNK